MALVKSFDITSDNAGKFNGATGGRAIRPMPAQAPVEEPPVAGRRVNLPQRKHVRNVARQQKAAERISAATTQAASGIAEASSAAEELRRAMQQISSGAEESASAAEESMRAAERIGVSINKQRESADTSAGKTASIQTLVGSVNMQMSSSIASVGRAAQRQAGSVSMVEELDKQAANIGEIVKAVARIADQTNLLALNAAIEAARAGQHGMGFAVVADEVRNLAETSERSARDIQNLIGQIQKEVKVIAEGITASAAVATSEVERGQAVSNQLEHLRLETIEILKGARAILAAAEQSSEAAKEAQKGSELVSAAAEQQSAACQEAIRTVDQQATALNQSEQASTELSEMTEELRNSSDIGKSAEEVATAAEELSSAVEEINRAATQILAALEQISRGAQQQAAATHQSSAAIMQIERAAQIASEQALTARTKGTAIFEMVQNSRTAVDQMISGVLASVDENARSREQINNLEQIARRIDKIVDSISTVSVQTNMLAVNGSIEAARAGEFGKGFMVVSTDIRNLARESSENAERIKDLVKAVQDQVVAVRRDLEEIAAAAVAEVEKNRAITTSFTTMEADMTIILDGNKDIAAGAAEILAALGEAKKGVEQISTAATEASQAAAQAAQAAREQSKGAEELASAVEEIAALAEELQGSEAERS